MAPQDDEEVGLNTVPRASLQFDADPLQPAARMTQVL